MQFNDSWDRLPGALLPFDWRAFFEKHKILYRDHGGLRTAFGPAAFRLVLYAIGQAAWAADQLLYPDWRQAKMQGPIFILGHQRSGTTFLHRLLSLDRTHARALKFHEMLLPATAFQRMLARIKAFDEKRGGPLQRRFQGIQEEKFGPMDDIHRLRFDEIEEDEFVLWTIYASAMCVNDSPISTVDEKLDALRRFDDWPVERQARAMGWYRACLLKKIHREPTPTTGHLPWIVSKNPAFTQKIPTLLKVFPKANLIHLVRNPLEAIPSRLSLIQGIWRHRFPGFDQMTKKQVRTILEDSYRIYLRGHRDIAAIPQSQKLVVTFDKLSADPKSAIEGIYSHFALPGPDEKLSEKLQELKGRGKKGDSKHKYTLEQFGLDADEIREKLTPVFEAHFFK